jgi:peptidoglycan-N-acetylglucosamine deacetylase
MDGRMKRFSVAVWAVCVLAASLCADAWARSAEAPKIAITIDDVDMHGDDTPRLNLKQRHKAILKALDRANIKAAFFVCGMRVDNKQGRKRLRAIDEEGHLIGNHSYLHLYYPKTPFETFAADVLRNELVIKDLRHFQRLFRFPYLKEGDTVEQRDRMRKFLRDYGYRYAYVTVDASEWAIDARLRKRLTENPEADLTPYRNFYLEHIWNRATYYDDLSRKALGRSVNHTLLIHHNLLAALFLDDLLEMFRSKGWTLINAGEAFTDPVFARMPEVVPAGESIIWAVAKESQGYENLLRYPAEDERYEVKRMDELGL